MNNQSIVNSSLQYLRRIFSLAKVPVDVAVVNYQEDKLYKSSNITWDFKFQSSSGLGAERQGKLFKSDYDALEYAEKLKNQSLEAAWASLLLYATHILKKGANAPFLRSTVAVLL